MLTDSSTQKLSNKIKRIIMSNIFGRIISPKIIIFHTIASLLLQSGSVRFQPTTVNSQANIDARNNETMG